MYLYSKHTNIWAVQKDSFDSHILLTVSLKVREILVMRYNATAPFHSLYNTLLKSIVLLNKHNSVKERPKCIHSYTDTLCSMYTQTCLHTYTHTHTHSQYMCAYKIRALSVFAIRAGSVKNLSKCRSSTVSPWPSRLSVCGCVRWCVSVTRSKILLGLFTVREREREGGRREGEERERNRE